MNKINTTSQNSIFETDHEKKLIAKGFDYEYETCSNEFSFYQYFPSELVVLGERPSDDEIQGVYPSNYEPYIFNKWGGIIGRARQFVQKSKVKVLSRFLREENARVLDIGCGAGNLLLLMKKYGKKTWQLHGNDLNTDALMSLKNMGIMVHACDYRDIPLSNYFDLIILNQVIEHFSDPRDLVDVCAKLLKPNGYIFIETPSSDGLDFKIFRSGVWGGYHIPRHFYIFNESNLSLMLKDYRYTVTKVDYLTSPAFWTQSLHHYFMERNFNRLAKIFHLKNLLLTALVTSVDLLIAVLGLKTSNMRIVARLNGDD
ncbi:Ubiquinone biosynthesis O-methyltransferase [Thalassocella blandensis]|nr:Ubiquinone biosynthesis O-methyltransferase [Thalassocella blandensis]